MAPRPDPRPAQDLPGEQPEDLPDMTGRTVVVTGASAGIGAAAARRLQRLGATVVPVGRSATKTAAVAAELGVSPELVDFADLSRLDRIDVLLNNAGGTWTKAPDHHRRARDDLPGQPPRAVPADGVAAGAVGAVRGAGRDHQQERGAVVRPGRPGRPRQQWAVHVLAGLRDHEAGERAVHPRAGPAVVGHRADRHLFPPGLRGHRVHPGLRSPRLARHPGRPQVRGRRSRVRTPVSSWPRPPRTGGDPGPTCPTGARRA